MQKKLTTQTQKLTTQTQKLTTHAKKVATHNGNSFHNGSHVTLQLHYVYIAVIMAADQLRKKMANEKELIEQHFQRGYENKVIVDI